MGTPSPYINSLRLNLILKLKGKNVLGVINREYIGLERHIDFKILVYELQLLENIIKFID